MIQVFPDMSAIRVKKENNNVHFIVVNLGEH
jgi:hypothetical protein